MKKIFNLLAMIFIFILFPFAWGEGRVETVRNKVSELCKKTIPDERLMDAVISAFDCIPNTKVVVNDCQITCLKENKGAVVGK
jgi:hypothetical protein